MRLVLAALLPAAVFALALAIVRRVRRRPLALAAPIALALLVCFEALSLRALSQARMVNATGVVLAHLGVLAMCCAAAPRWMRELVVGAPRQARRGLRRLGSAELLLAPLLVLVALSSVRYAPNTWDSMTYHLARVAHWIQHASLEPYLTLNERQIVLAPGAEYLLLVLQVVSRSDLLANFLQLLCWVLMVLAGPPLARIAGAPRDVARWVGVFVGAAPMAVLQASSTQNDLVAAVMALAILVASLPFLHGGGGRWRTGDVLLLGASVAAGAVVKTTALLAASPWLVAVAIVGGAGFVRDRERRIGRVGAIFVGLGLVAAVAGGSLVLAADAVAGRHWLKTYAFPAWGEWTARLENVLRGTAHHLPFPRSLVVALGMPGEICGGPWCTEFFRQFHEDFAGNLLQASILVLLLGIGAARWRRLAPRERFAIVAPFASWMVFHLFLRENTWISRLHVPSFAVAATAFASLAASRRPSWPLRTALVVAAAVLVAQGAEAAVKNQSRPALRRHRPATDRATTYYLNLPDVKPGHDAALAAAVASGCRRLGVNIGGNGYDYPLTWRAMQAGIEVRYVLQPDAWPCVFFTESPPPPPRPEGPPWIPTGNAAVFVTAPASSTKP